MLKRDLDALFCELKLVSNNQITITVMSYV